MELREIAAGISDARLVVDTDTHITDICYDSRRVIDGSLFVAVGGTNTNGSRYIADAVEAGAAAIMADKERPGDYGVPEGIGYIYSSDTRIALAQASDKFFGHPSRSMKLIGITGTSGKTTVSHIVHSIFCCSGAKCGLIGTINVRIGKSVTQASHTTPISRDLQEIFALMRDEASEACVMEVSSHALDQGRVEGADFDVCAFLNIARDHLDYHITPDAYKAAKLQLFVRYARPDSVCVLNMDDPFAHEIKEVCHRPVLTFGLDEGNDVTARDAAVYADHVEFILCIRDKSLPVRLGMGGVFNVSNVLAAAAICHACGIGIDDIKKGVELCPPVSGRFQAVPCDKPYSVIVDYAHTPDELESLLRSARGLAKGRLLCLFGCGGNRDTGKRPIMGRIAVNESDRVFITSDNPRNEEPCSIINDIMTGIPADKLDSIVVEPDRRNAIRLLLSEAAEGDVAVIAGKGHEGYQEIKGVRRNFNDLETAEDILKTL